MQKELRLSGSGGQGVITAAIIFAEAAAACGRKVAQSQSYGPEARGGASRSEVIVSDDVIYHPHVEHPDIVLAMTQAAADKYAGDLDPEKGILIVDSELVPNVPAASHIVAVPITTLAIEKIGKALFANIVALGTITRVSGIVPLEAVKTAVSHRVPPHTVDANMQALMVGYEAAEAAVAQK